MEEALACGDLLRVRLLAGIRFLSFILTYLRLVAYLRFFTHRRFSPRPIFPTWLRFLICRPVRASPSLPFTAPSLGGRISGMLRQGLVVKADKCGRLAGVDSDNDHWRLGRRVDSGEGRRGLRLRRRWSACSIRSAQDIAAVSGSRDVPNSRAWSLRITNSACWRSCCLDRVVRRMTMSLVTLTLLRILATTTGSETLSICRESIQISSMTSFITAQPTTHQHHRRYSY